MKKTYLRPETNWMKSYGVEYLMQTTSPKLNVNDNEDDEEVEEFEELLANPRWEEEVSKGVMSLW